MIQPLAPVAMRLTVTVPLDRHTATQPPRDGADRSFGRLPGGLRDDHAARRDQHEARLEVMRYMKLVLILMMIGAKIPDSMIRAAKAAGMDGIAASWEAHNEQVDRDDRAARERTRPAAQPRTDAQASAMLLAAGGLAAAAGPAKLAPSQIG